MSYIFPQKIKINREEDYHTHYIGEFNNGDLFFAYQTFNFDKPYNEIPKDEKMNHRSEYISVYIFNKNGKFKNAIIKYLGKASDLNGQSQKNTIESILQEIDKYVFKDIEVEPFSISFNGIIFGLIPEPETESIVLQPMSTIAFYEPWDGEYDT